MKNPVLSFFHFSLIVTLLNVPGLAVPVDAFAADKVIPPQKKTLTFHEGYSLTPNPTEWNTTFEGEKDLGGIAGITAEVMNKVFEDASQRIDNIAGQSGVVQNVMNMGQQAVDSLGAAATLGTSSGGGPGPRTFGPSSGGSAPISSPSQPVGNAQTITVNPNTQAASIQINKPAVPPGAVVVQIPQGGSGTVALQDTVASQPDGGTSVAVTPEQAANGQMVAVRLPDGSVSSVGTHSLTSSDIQSGGSSYPSNMPHVEGLVVGVRLKPYIFQAMDANKEFESEMELEWSPTVAATSGQEFLSKIPIGKLKAHTRKFRYRRQCGFGAHLKVDLEWMSKWHNDVVDYSPSDVDMNIDSRDIDPLGAATVVHSDVIDPFPINPVALVGSLAAKLGAKGMAVTAAKTMGEKIFDQLSIGVTTVQNTFNRALEVTLIATGKDVDGNTVGLGILGDNGSSTIVFDGEGKEFPIYVSIPQESKPIKEVTFKVASAVYRYSEIGNFEVGVSCKGIDLPLNTSPLTSFLGKVASEDHTVTSSATPEYTVPIEPLVQVKFSGIVETGDPRAPAEGAIVTLDEVGKNSTFKSATTDAAGRFFGDFLMTVADAAAYQNPSLHVMGKKYVEQTTAANPSSFAREKDGSWRIYAPLNPQQTMSVYGHVMDMQDQAVAGAEVIFDGEGIQQGVVSAADGTYTFQQVPVCDRFTLYVNKDGYYFQPVPFTRQGNQKGIAINLKAATAQLSRKSVKLTLMPVNGAAFPQYVTVTHADGKSLSYAQTGGAVIVPVNSMSDTLTLSQSGYTFTPPSVTAQFSGDLSAKEERNFNVAAVPVWSHAVTLTAAPASIETGGTLNDTRAEEHGRAEAKVVDALNRPVPNVSVRFTDTGDDAHTGLTFANEQNGNGYAFTDASGTAAVDFVAHGLGKITVLATALDHYMATGSAQDEVKSNAVEVTAVANTRTQNPQKPSVTITASAEQKAITTQDMSVKIETGGSVKFQLAPAFGNSPAGGAPVPGDSFTGYKLFFYKDGQQMSAELFDAAPPPSLVRTFTHPGAYRVSVQVREKYYENEVWSDPAEASFLVEELRPPEVTLTIPNRQGTVNLPVDWSFNVNGYATLKNIILQFGDNKADINLDPGLLAGRRTWSGSYYHTYDAEGTYTVFLKATDTNDKSAETSQTVTVGSIAALNDHTAPTGAVSINSGASSTASRTVVLHITGSDNNGGSGVYRARLSNDGSNWNNWNYVSWPDDRPMPSVAMDFAWQLSDTGGEKTVYVQLKDAAENISASFSDSITYQNSVSLSGAAGDGSSPGIYPGSDQPMYTWDHQAPTGSVTVSAVSGSTASLALVMQDGGTAPGNRMCFSGNGTQWTAWELFSPSKDVAVVSGQAKVYVKYADGVGNVSPAYFADIPAASGGGAPTQASSQPAQQTDDQTNGQAGGGVTPQSGAQAVNQQESSGATGQQQAAQEPGADWSVARLGLSEKPVAGKKMFIVASLKALKGTGKGDAEVTFRPEGGMAETRRVTLDGRTDEDVRFDWVPSKSGKNELTIEVRSEGDPDHSNDSTRETIEVEAGAFKQKQEVLEEGAQAGGAAPGDASIIEMKIEREFWVGKPSKVEVRVENLSEGELSGCELVLSDGRGFRKQERVSFKKKGKDKVKIEYVPQAAGRQTLSAALACPEDADLANNSVQQEIEVREDKAPGAALADTGGLKDGPEKKDRRREKGALPIFDR